MPSFKPSLFLFINRYKDSQKHLAEERRENSRPTNQERSAEKTSPGSGMTYRHFYKYKWPIDCYSF